MKKLYLFLGILLSFTTTTLVAHTHTPTYFTPKKGKLGNVAALKGSNFNTTAAKTTWAASRATEAALPAAPTAISPQVYTGMATIANLTATGTNLKWYTASTDGTPLSTTTSLVDGTTYYVSQTASGLESIRTAVLVRKISEATLAICGSATVANLVSTPTTGATTKWFTSTSSGTALANPDAITTGTYYVEQSKYVPTTISKLTEGSGSLSSIAIEADGKILIAEGILSGIVQRMDADGKNSEIVASIPNASSVAVQADGKLLVADATTSLKRMDADGKNLVSFGTGLTFTTNILVQPNGKILVIDDYEVKRMDADGTNLVTIADSFNLPYDLALQADGKIVVADTFNGLVKRMNADGSNIVTLGTGMIFPTAVEVMTDGKILVTDDDKVKLIDVDGTTTETLYTDADGGLISIAVTANDKILVANNNNFNKFEINELVVGTTETSNRVAVNVTVNTNPTAPAASAQSVCATATVADLVATGTGTINWYTAATGGTALAPTTTLVAGNYFASQTIGTCESTTRTSITVTVSAAISTATAVQTNVSCNGGSNGSASVTPSGGAGGYTYSWSPSGGTAATATGLSAGIYTVTVTDANGCTATRNFTITQPTAISTATAVQTNVSCNGGSNGSASVTPSGGAGGYTYSWSPSGGTAATATGLSAGIYTVTVTDANGCTTTQGFTITQPTALVATAAAQTNVSCNGGANASATVSVSGGTSGYTYSWAPSGGTAATATGLASGTYTVTVTDANGCTTTQNFTITQPTVLLATAAAQTNVSCNGGSNGSATVGVSGGTSSYTYAWAPSGGTAATASGLRAGTYTVTVTDANGCTATQNFTITQPTAINFTTTVLSGYDYNTGYSETIVTSGGTGSKTYAVTAGSLPSGFSLSIAGQITGTSTQITDSNFTVTATDATSCTATYNYILKLDQIPITVTATPSQTKVYGEIDPILTYTVSPSLLSGDSFTGSLTRVSGENIGNYAINQGSLSAGSKYLITYAGANFTITAKPITVTANASQTKVYGTTDPVFAYTVSPSLVSGDSFTGALTRTVGENVGTYTIAQGTLSAGGNYTITYNGSNFTITKADQVITWNQTLGFGCNGATSIVLTAASNSGLAVNYASSNSNIASVSNNSLLFQNYGSTTITASQPGNMNYNAAPTVVLPVVTSQPNLIRKQFENIIFFDNSSKNFKSYSWYKNGVLVPGQTSQSFKENGSLNGTYHAVATKLDGTLITSCPLTLSPTIVEEYMRIVPNPVRSNTNFQLMTNISASRIQNARVEIFNLTGNLLTTVNTSQSNIDMIAPIVEGIYIIKITLANGTYFTKNLLVRK
ncbi:hypothetical protein FVB9288_02161 [Flavobacterium sp. CECT 9288]|uniref:MBG domain-containing protein n=1 Tax=Flavobacterium sp. CECT 9288 TaxID=2845819 RepID=UPI001E2FF44D|nr:MBG domain-containing protein [Flavobacterium sp. CECT 9288]CAH0336459.1 hypothetical protein FVB9288_02161 [Flavobacterium sp. CECT 9288]